MTKISILITSFKEPKTIGKAIESFLKQKIKNYELIVTAPDKETLDVVKIYSQKNKRIKILKDDGKGKPNALNKAFKKLNGEYVILSDGDVYVSENSVNELVKNFNKKDVGGVSARVISTNNRNNLFGYWAYVLSEGFHNLREKENKIGKNIICSGYLYAIKRELFENIPGNILADDSYISFLINSKKYRTIYEPNAKVYVKYPDNLIDWIKQKKRTAGRFYQLKTYFKISKIHSFKEEIFSGIKTISLIKNFKELFFFLFLIVMRIYIWIRVFLDFRLWGRDFKKTWKRVESTK